MKLQFAMLFTLVLSACPHLAAASEPALAIRNVEIIDVENGARREAQTVVIANGKIAAVGPVEKIKSPRDALIVDGTGKYLIPGLWDMHVHSHRDGRAAYHYPLFRAHGVTGIRDAGSHLGSALAAKDMARSNPLAPRIIWGSPIVDGAPPFNSFGLSAEDEASGRQLVELMQRLGFDFIKVYDRLSPEAYRGIAEEARRRKMPVEGHVPLSLSPAEATQSGQNAIDHMTLILEACSPGALQFVEAEFSKSPEESDSLGILMDARLSELLAVEDEKACDALIDSLAAAKVWQIPTFVQARGYFFANDPAFTNDPRTVLTTPELLEDWRKWGLDADPAGTARGRAVLVGQMRLALRMMRSGVKFLAGTDASSEPYVYAGASLHDELSMLVDAGLSPVAALQAATLNPRLYLGRQSDRPLISKGEWADLVLLSADPLALIGNTRQIEGVAARGRWSDRAALDALLEEAKAIAASER
jgi:imidazolonepropionase-like amidohydrolase